MIRKWKGAALLAAVLTAVALVAVPVVAGAQGWSGMMGGGAGGFGGMMGGGAGGFGGMTGGGAGNMWNLHNQELNAAAKVLGISVSDLSQALAEQSVEQLAESKGTTAEAVWTATQQVRTAYVDTMVQAGTVTRAQADQLLSFYNSMGAMTLYGGAMMNTGACHGAGGGYAPTSQT